MIDRAVKIWLFIGVVMVFVQIMIGGVTRLTGSGLSITKWEIVTGTVPPLNEDSWNAEFEKYQQTPQYHKINRGMSLDEFKFIYFWEFFHRLWARLMGFVFIIPLIWFLVKRKIPSQLQLRLVLVFCLAVLVASFGWIMVASGLVSRPWVNAYKLSIHLGLGLLLFGYLFWTWLVSALGETKGRSISSGLRWIFGLLIVQILLGGLMSGMKAGLYYPTWPDMHGSMIPGLIFEPDHWKWVHFTDYDTNGFTPAIVQFAHRLVAYLLVVIGVMFAMRGLSGKAKARRVAIWYFLVAITFQVMIGIITVLNSVGKVPVLWGVVHQAGAIFVLMSVLYLVYISQSGQTTTTVGHLSPEE